MILKLHVVSTFIIASIRFYSYTLLRRKLGLISLYVFPHILFCWPFWGINGGDQIQLLDTKVACFEALLLYFLISNLHRNTPFTVNNCVFMLLLLFLSLLQDVLYILRLFLIANPDYLWDMEIGSGLVKWISCFHLSTYPKSQHAEISGICAVMVIMELRSSLGGNKYLKKQRKWNIH